METQIRNENVEANANIRTTRAYNFDNPPLSKLNHGVLVIFTVRSIAIILTFVSVIILGAAKETVILSNSTMYGGIIKSTQFPAYVYFIIANVVVLLYSIASLVLLFANRNMLSRISVPLSIGDLIMVALLFSCNAAAASVSIISDIGQPIIAWNNICSVLVKFCSSVKAAIVLSMLDGVIYLLLVVHALVGNIQKQQQVN